MVNQMVSLRCFFFSSRRRHTRFDCDWSSDVCSSDLWKARPDWSSDGTHVVYSSYLGRQWNQLWLTTSEGGDPFPLTYGEFDATAPRWSRDGSRIAFVSNEGGNTSLWVVGVGGGRREPVEMRERHYREPVGLLRVTV